MISIHASRGGSDNPLPFSKPLSKIISIHASRGGSDAPVSFLRRRVYHFNPRFPRGKRLCKLGRHRALFQFQSTLPAGEATARRRLLNSFTHISIHASRGGSDARRWRNGEASTEFQSTLPAGEATCALCKEAVNIEISIHASRGGSDLTQGIDSCSCYNFNPRFPRGKRPKLILKNAWRGDFNPRFPRGKRLPHRRPEICI